MTKQKLELLEQTKKERKQICQDAIDRQYKNWQEGRITNAEYHKRIKKWAERMN